MDCGSLLLETGVLDSFCKALPDLIKHKQTLAERVLSFFSTLAYNMLLKDWIAKNVLPLVLDQWEKISQRVTIVTPCLSLLSTCCNMHRGNQAMVSNYLVEV